MSTQLDRRHDYSRYHRRVGDLAAEIRREDESEPERARALEKWKRTENADERKAKSDTAASFKSYVRACGFSTRSEHLLLVACAATSGEDELTRAADWKMGVWIENGTAEDMQRVAPLHSKDSEKRRLAQKWKRAWNDFDVEQERAGFDAVRRRHGDKARNGNSGRDSELHAVFVEHLIEIERKAKRMPNFYKCRFECFDRAARFVVKRLKKENPRAAKLEPEKRKSRLRQEDTPALCCWRLTAKIRKLAEDEMQRALAAGANVDDVYMMIEAAFAELGEAFAETTSEPDPELEHSATSFEDPSLEEQGSSNTDFESTMEGENCKDFADSFYGKAEENRETVPCEVFTFEDLDNTPSDAASLPNLTVECDVELDSIKLAEADRLEACRISLNSSPPSVPPPEQKQKVPWFKDEDERKLNDAETKHLRSSRACREQLNRTRGGQTAVQRSTAAKPNP